MIKTKGKLITKENTYILKGVKAHKNYIYGGNGYCFDTTEKQLIEVETIDNQLYLRVERYFENKKDYILEVEQWESYIFYLSLFYGYSLSY